MTDWNWEPLPGGLRLWVSPAHKFGTDAFLLSAFANVRGGLACDLGSGCGIIPALWFQNPETAPERVYAVDLQEEAFALMRRSVEEGGLPEGRFIPVLEDLRRLTLPRGCFDLVTCNPPYKAAGHGILSSGEARRTARHETQCTLEEVCGAAAALLRYRGRFCICQRPERLADAVCAMRAHDLEPKRLRFVQRRPGKAPWLFLLEGRQGGKPFLQVEPPLVMEGPAGLSEELLGIYGSYKTQGKAGGGQDCLAE